MKRLIKKLRNKKGESLVESLTAILIFTFASIILLSMVATAAKINQTVKQEDEQIAAELYYAEAQMNEEGAQPLFASPKVKITYGDQTDTIDVDTFSAKDGSLYSFFVKGAAGEGE